MFGTPSANPLDSRLNVPGEFNAQNHTLEECNKLAESIGIGTKFGTRVFSWLACQRDSSKHSSVHKHNEQVRKMSQSLANMGKLIKIRLSQVDRVFKGNHKLPGFEALAFHQDTKGVENRWRGPDGRFHMKLERPTEPHTPYLSQFHQILEEVGLCGHTNSPKGNFAFRLVRNRIKNFRPDEDLEPTPGLVVPSEMRVATALSVANALEADGRWKPVNITRLSAMEKSRTDDAEPENAFTQIDLIRFVAPKEAYPQYEQYNFKDRFGNPLYDPETKQWRRIKTGTNAEKTVDRLYDEMEVCFNGAEDQFGRGFAIIPIIHEPLTMHRRVLEKLEKGGTPVNLPLTEDEAAYNESIQLLNWQNKFPDREIGEIKYMKPQPMVLEGSDEENPFMVSFYVFNYQNINEATWGQDAKGVGVGKTLKRETYGDDRSLFTEDYPTLGKRDEVDHYNRRQLEKPQMINEFGTGLCGVYSILTPDNFEHMLTSLMPQYLAQLVNWNIKFSTGEENLHTNKEGKVVPRYQMEKFDLLTVMSPFELYGPGARVIGTEKRVRMIAQIRFTDMEVKSGNRPPPPYVNIPAKWSKGESNYDILVPIEPGKKSNIYVNRDPESGHWLYKYVAPMDHYFRRRFRAAKEAVEGYTTEGGKYEVSGLPKVYARDRDLMHIFEWYFRWADQLNVITDFQRRGRKISDSNYYQSWDSPLLIVDGEKEGDPTVNMGDPDVCFESLHFFITEEDKPEVAQRPIGQILADLISRIRASSGTTMPDELRAEIMALLRAELGDDTARQHAAEGALFLELAHVASQARHKTVTHQEYDECTSMAQELRALYVSKL